MSLSHYIGFLNILRQISNAFPFEGRLKTHGLERIFEVWPKDKKLENSNSEVGLLLDLVDKFYKFKVLLESFKFLFIQYSIEI